VQGRFAEPATTRQHALLHGVVITTTAAGMGTVLGLLKDVLLAGYFGANGGTDAFLVAWMLPETAVTLLMDGALPLLMVPIFSRALELRKEGDTASNASVADPVAVTVAATLPHLIGALLVVAVLVTVSAPWLVPALAPGLTNVTLGIVAMRIIAVSVVFVGTAGYLAAALRSHLIYGPPAVIKIAINVGIIGVMVLCRGQLGVLAVALGVVIGSALMVAVQLPAFVRRIGLPRRPIGSGGFAISAFLPIAAYILTRHLQVFVERFVASSLTPGSITHLNYVQKIGQVPSMLALGLAWVTFPQLARNVATGKTGQARHRTAVDVQIIGAIVLAATAYLFAFAPQVVQFLLQRGAFTADDTATTSAILRIYVWALLGQVLLDIVCRSLFSERATFVPTAGMMLGLLVTAIVAGFGAPVWGAPAIAAANALGITVTTIVVVCNRRSSIIPCRTVGLIIARLLPSTGLATVFALWLATYLRDLPAAASVIMGGLAVAVVFGLAAVLTRGLPLPRKLAASLRLIKKRAPNREGAIKDA
jgi:putative peptidoglycan lipid II flippase